MKKVYIALLAATTFVGCKKENTEGNFEDTDGGINLSYMDTLVKPQDNFYDYVNGTWMKETKVPSDKGRWGSFNELREETDSASLALLKQTITESHDKGSEGQKVTDLYQSIMDTVARNKAGIAPIESELQSLDAIQSLEEVTSYLVNATQYQSNPLFGFGVYANMKNSNQNAVYLNGPSLGMSRDYFQKDDAESQSKIKAYQNYLERLFTFINDESPKKSAEAVVKLENQMADYILGFADLRNSDKKYNPVSTNDLDEITTSVYLKKYLQDVGVQTDTVIIPEINYYKNLDKVYNQENLFALKKYLKADLANGASSTLSSKLEQLNFDFYSKELRGIEEMRALDKRALSTINGTIGQAFGKLYVEKYFPAEAKDRAETMVKYLKKSYEQHINNLTWMTDETKQKALDKLNKFTVKIGYPNQWKDYSDLTIVSVADGGSYFENMKNIMNWDYKEDLKKIGQPVDKSEWHMPPQTVNAYYNPSFNEIVFPAAILQPPFFNFNADAAVNFGGIGAVIGHEISHGFDDSGAKYDGDGNLNNWWSEKDKEEFNKLGEKLSAQFSAYEPFPEVHVNGDATLGENIADLAGLNVAFDALQMYLKDNGNPGELQGFTQNQRFFISWATIWRTKYKDEALKNQLKTDFHSPGYYRAIGPLENIQAFYDAFDVKPGDGMYKAPDQRIIIW